MRTGRPRFQEQGRVRQERERSVFSYERGARYEVQGKRYDQNKRARTGVRARSSYCRESLEADSRGELHSPVVRYEVTDLIWLDRPGLVGIEWPVIELHNRH